MIGPSGDAYTPRESLGCAEAAEYHRLQAEALAAEQVDFLFAPTFPAVEEALGAATAMGRTGLPYVVSFVLDEWGSILDGGSHGRDRANRPRGLAGAALLLDLVCLSDGCRTSAGWGRAQLAGLAQRIVELKANGSPLHTNELVRLDHLETTPPEEFAEFLWSVHTAHSGLRVIGGCCGTDDRHMRALGRLMAEARA